MAKVKQVESSEIEFKDFAFGIRKNQGSSSEFQLIKIPYNSTGETGEIQEVGEPDVLGLIKERFRIEVIRAGVFKSQRDEVQLTKEQENA